MTDRQQLLLAICVTALMFVPAAGVFLWLLWHLFWDAFDHLLQQHTRNKNRVEADLSTDIRMKHQLHGPAAFRDVKGVHR